MLHSATRATGRTSTSSRSFHSSDIRLVLKPLQKGTSEGRTYVARDAGGPTSHVLQQRPEIRRTLPEARKNSEHHTIKRNEVGVQMLSRRLHRQIFRNVCFPPPQATYVRIAREHIRAHGLEPSQCSVLPDTGFTLPPLQGSTIDEHFYRIGTASAQPWLGFAKQFAAVQPPPPPDCWHIQPGWTRYHYSADGSSWSESVSAPDEAMLSFDVETLPAYHNFAVMACAMSAKCWYSWISPWLLGETEDPQQLIPLGDPKQHRIVVGHNVSYDRARVLEEYSLLGTETRFIDTMALHIAVKGISSHQRPAWMKYRKSKKEQLERKDEAVETALDLMRQAELQQQAEVDVDKRAELQRFQQAIAESLPQLQADDADEASSEDTAKRWEEITSANSLADVAKLYCDIDVEKETRNDFMTHTPAQIVANIQDYLDYCCNDVHVTHAVFARAFPAYLTACPSPVSLAGVLTMGSSFLTVNEEWEMYLQNAETKYRELDDKIKKRLAALAEEARLLMVDEKWKDDVWLSQLDWMPKVAGKSRGVDLSPLSASKPKSHTKSNSTTEPSWFRALRDLGPFHANVKHRILPLLFRTSYEGHPLRYSSSDGWTYINDKGMVKRPSAVAGLRVWALMGKSLALKHLQTGRMTTSYPDLSLKVAEGNESITLSRKIMRIATQILKAGDLAEDPWISQLDWKSTGDDSSPPAEPAPEPPPRLPITWPKWYWDLAKPKKDMPPGSIDVTVRNRLAPLLLRLSWRGWPLFHSREHGWIFRVSSNANFETRQKKLHFYDPADAALQELTLSEGCSFYKLPHKDGEEANVGSPLAKTFIKYAQDGTLTSPGDVAKDALDMNAQCSYWISSRDRILKQMVVWEGNGLSGGFPKSSSQASQKWGIIVPQVITMGTVTRRAIEKTWLTASNAKKNRVGSELKAMIRAPEGYAIVGADVDSEELWISSAMGDAQFGFHGATAIGWMTLEGTKAGGTDLHSKTASILGISRDQAKVFNYSRIYGAGMRHAVLLLLQGNAGLLPETAQKQAEKLYASTKGKNTHRTDMFGRKFWFGGTESFLFNKLEEIALSDRPQTPALGCGVTYALSKEYLPAGFGTDYMTSRINWVVQSSGVDYLHLLIVSMQHLIAKYDIKARYLISVHDEIRYLVAEEDKYRAALALQIANLWTRSLFAYRLGMDDLPQGVAFFSAVDVDKVLRKEVDLPCVTPSQTVPIAAGESLDIAQVLEKTNSGSLWRDARQMVHHDGAPLVGTLEGYAPPNCMVHRASSSNFLRAQATPEFNEVKKLAQMETGETFEGGIGGPKRRRGRPRKIGDSCLLDWDAELDRSSAVA